MRSERSAPDDPDSPVARLVRALVTKQPRRMSELEPIVGSIHMSFSDDDLENMGFLERPPLRAHRAGEFTALVPRLSIKYRFDMYHETPSHPRDVGFEQYTLEVRGDADVAVRVLRDKLGPPATIDNNGVTYAAFHPFYLVRRDDRFVLEWYAEVPRFAIPSPNASARAAWVSAFARRIASAKTIDEVDAFCKAAPIDAGIKITGTLNSTANRYGLPAVDGRDYWIEFVPPVRAKVIATAFGWGEIVGVSHDVHMSSWYAQRVKDDWLPISGVTAQWQIQASFTTIPMGGDIARGRRVADADEIAHLAIQPRFK